MPPASSSSSSIPLLQRPGVRQLIKFCLVGASSTILDKGVYWYLYDALPGVPWWAIQTMSFCVGVTNGFIWNRRWTFQGQGEGGLKRQYPLFVLTNVIGLMLNLGITKLFLVLLTGQLLHGAHNPEKRVAFLASLCAIPIVVFWNFSASKFLTFRDKGR